MLNDDLQDRFVGSLLGLAVGDATGAPFEGLSASHIYQTGPASEILENPREYFFIKNQNGATLRYTDDTQMTIGVAETLIECGEINADFLIERFLFHFDPNRGYGRGIQQLFRRIRRGTPPLEAALAVFPDGSFGNGAAMRVAPVGLFFADDPDRIVWEAEASSATTHRHPLGIEGAKLLALAVGMAATTPVGSLDRGNFLDRLLRWAETEEFQWQLKDLSEIDRDVPLSFGCGVEAHRSVVSAIQLFVDYPDSFSKVLQQAIGLGGDTDTLAAMACAISGAYLGKQAIPTRLLDALENDSPNGRDGIERLAFELFDRGRRRDF